ncbi:MAG: bifunctional DNA-formamidopyrimidine glycosylase/DNA-(apurinic or apyrimidinic site) lyase [Chloroflexi bacterium]|nr:bifunctional DNA-formamidopyrimidine glycosylase/DNA-(apurinic or apyrimidinic site) lyase [Chloroflexota bacterium]
MPELPEVENLRRYLIAEHVPGQVISSVDVAWARTIKLPSIEDFVLDMPGRRVVDINRRAKYLDVALDKGHLVLHMGMTGSLRVSSPGDERMRFAHTVFHLADGRRIELNDPRKWASVWLVDKLEDALPEIGPEPLDTSFTADEFVRRVSKRRSPIKAVLLDQAVIAGVGNIYADEALLRAGIAPSRRAHRIAEHRLAALLEEIRISLARAINYIGENPLDDGRPFVVDAFDERMQILRKPGSDCPQCGRALRTKVIGGRTAYYCGECQS